MNVTAGVLQKLLAALNECTEWVSESLLHCSSEGYAFFCLIDAISAVCGSPLHCVLSVDRHFFRSRYLFVLGGRWFIMPWGVSGDS